MKRPDKSSLWPQPQYCSIICPKCSRPAARLAYDPPVARYLHYTRSRAYWHTVILHRHYTGEEENRGKIDI